MQLEEKQQMIGFPKGKIAFRMFDESDLDSLHWGTLDVLENAGIKILSEECLKLLEDAGCTVDRKDSSAKILGNLVGKGIKKAPSTPGIRGTTSFSTAETHRPHQNRRTAPPTDSSKPQQGG